MRTSSDFGSADARAPAINWSAAFAGTMLALTLARLATLIFAAHELGPDETQYWFWSLSPDFGYFSKPPFIAWTIAATTTLFGDGEAAVRLAAPLFHAGAASAIFLLARDIYGARAGFWAGVSWLLLPGVIVSSAIISTDPPMLMFWSIALWAFFRLGKASGSSRMRLIFAAMLGGALGLGFLSKYAIIYFPIGIIGALIVSPEMRRNARIIDIALASAIAGAFAAPNIFWNAANEFQTLSHTAANANWGADLLHPLELLEFVGAQFGVAGPLILVIMAMSVLSAWGLIRRGEARDPSLRDRERALTCFIVPVIVIICIQAFLSRAHANWAAAAYPAATVLAAGVALRAAETVRKSAAFNAIRLSALLHAIVALVYSAALVSPAFANGIGLGVAFKRLRGWERHGAEIAEIALRATPPYDAIVADDREVLGGLAYYARAAGKPNARFAAFNSNNRIEHHYEAFHPFTPSRDKLILYVTTNADAIALTGRFGHIAKVAQSTAPLGGGGSRTLYVFEARDYLGAP
ncbi:MAG: glycosyltransferase family 39 protein [Pseudomonadota bacterium]